MTEPVVYLCPTIQLVKQVIEEANKLGINAMEYPAGEPHPTIECTRGKAIIVCTYDKLFNAKSTFERSDVKLRPSAIVCDDAHAGIEEIRDAFTLKIPSEDALYLDLINLLSPACEHYDFSAWGGIVNRDPQELFEVPYWILNSLHDELHRKLAVNAKRDNFIFVWPYLSDILKRCRLVIAASGIEIMPDIIPTHKVFAFDKAAHRLFMSATLADDSALIRDLGCAYEAASKPIVPTADKGLGERMVIAPSLVDRTLDRKWVMQICTELSKRMVHLPNEWVEMG